MFIRVVALYNDGVIEYYLCLVHNEPTESNISMLGRREYIYIYSPEL